MSSIKFRRLFPAVVVAAVVGFSTASVAANAAPVEWGAFCNIGGPAPTQTNHPSGVYLWKLSNGSRLDPGQSCSWGRGKLIMQTSGNLQVLDELGNVRWSSATRASGGHHAIMQPDGNFVIYNSADRAVWSSYTASPTVSKFLAVQTDGNLVIYDATWKVYWATDTNHSGSGGIPPVATPTATPTTTATATPTSTETPSPPPLPTDPDDPADE